MSRIIRKQMFCICENKNADQLCGNRETDQRLCFCNQIVQSLYVLNPKFQASSHLLWLCSLVCVGPGLKPECWFSPDAAHMTNRFNCFPHMPIKMSSFLIQNSMCLFLGKPSAANFTSDLYKLHILSQIT